MTQISEPPATEDEAPVAGLQHFSVSIQLSESMRANDGGARGRRAPSLAPTSQHHASLISTSRTCESVAVIWSFRSSRCASGAIGQRVVLMRSRHAASRWTLRSHTAAGSNTHSAFISTSPSRVPVPRTPAHHVDVQALRAIACHLGRQLLADRQAMRRAQLDQLHPVERAKW
jgi:hypothetical protein